MRFVIDTIECTQVIGIVFALLVLRNEKVETQSHLCQETSYNLEVKCQVWYGRNNLSLTVVHKL